MHEPDPPGRLVGGQMALLQTRLLGSKTIEFRILPALLTLILALAGLQNAGADYVAYSVGENSKSPLPERIDNVDTKYLLNIEWGEYSGRKARLGVLEVDNNSAANSYTVSTMMGDINYSDSSTGVPVHGIEAIVIDSLSQSGRFRLVERTELGDVLAEQDPASSGRIAKPSGAKTGYVLGAEYLVQLVVTDYETKTSGTDKDIGGLLTKKVPLPGGVTAGSSSGRVGLNIRLIDAETSEIAFTQQIEAVIKETNLAFGGAGLIGDVGLGGFMSQYSKTPVGQAVIAGINQAVFELIKQVGAKPPEGSIVKADATQIYTNLSQEAVAIGDRLQVLRKGEELIDPETGISLGGSTTALGEIEISQLQEKFSIARPLSLSGTPERGDKVMGTKAAAPLESAKSGKKPK
jgi:curli biogenesis system outer membrane secretion channel CsgG